MNERVKTPWLEIASSVMLKRILLAKTILLGGCTYPTMNFFLPSEDGVGFARMAMDKN